MAPSYRPVPSEELKTMPAHLATTTLRVEGMTCGACTSAIETGFRGMSGIGTVSVSLVMERAIVTHDPATISADQIKTVIEDRGFDAVVLSTDNLTPPRDSQQDGEDEIDDERPRAGSSCATTTLRVEGMTCGACTSAIDAGFQDVPGVKSCSVSLLSERVVVEHDTTLLSPQQIVTIIEEKGFDATVLDTRAPQPLPSASARRKGRKQQIALATTTVAVEGMTCGACTSAVEAGFNGVDGVVRFNLSLLAERAVVVHDPSRLSTEKIVSIIEDRGFDARILSSQLQGVQQTSDLSTAQLKLFGLTDASRASALESDLRSLSGVRSAVIALNTSRATVVHDPSRTGLRAIVEAIEGAGFNALIADSDDSNAQLESLAKTKEIQEWRRAFRICLCFAFPVFFINIVFPMCIPALDFGRLALPLPGLYMGDVASLLLTMPVQFGIGRRFYRSAFKSLRHGSPTMDVLVVLGTSAAFFFSFAAMLVSVFAAPHTRPSTVFDTSTMLITFITLGRYLENRAKGQTSKALSRLMSLAPSMATIYTDPIAADKAAEQWDLATSPADEKSTGAKDGGAKAAEEKVIPTELIQVGDIVILRPGDKIPADGTITRGESYVDESMVTGEAMPILKRAGSAVIAGTVNGNGRIDFRVTRAGRDTQLSQIVKLVQEAQTSRAPIQRMADIVAGYFVPCVITLGLVTFVGWWILSHLLPHPPAIFTSHESGGTLMVCLKLCISVIVFACPCALGLSTPTAVMVGTGVGAEHGILVKGGAALEMATRITHIVLDKTGTLTMGKMSVADAKLESVWESNEWRKRLWWTLVGLAEMGSEHPVGRAALVAAKGELGLGSEGTIDGSIGEFEAVVGRGVSALVEPTTSAERRRFRVLVGNARYLRDRGVTVPAGTSPHVSPSRAPRSSKTGATEQDGRTTIFVAIDDSYAGQLSLSDTLKPTATAAITALHRLGITTSLVTGDQASAAHAIAEMVGISRSSVHAGVSPDQKQSIIRDLQEAGEVVAMVGDGINDSPALATADVGIAMASGTDVAMEAADIVLMRPQDLLDVPGSLHLARTIFNRIKLNLVWACIYNIIGLPFAMGFFLPFGWHLHPMAAGLAMAASSVSVVGSSLLLKFWKRPRWMSVAALENEQGNAAAAAGLAKRRRSRAGWRAATFNSRFSFPAVRAWWPDARRRGDEASYVPLRDVEPDV
ncbi:MAG: hypothetical protein M1838_004014 [Thelocarpon superellum]|nr:MAG: hypothetical protein M1838_004014 [Thelocarpon superellum]